MPRTEEEMMDLLGSENAFADLKEAAAAARSAFDKGSSSLGAGGGQKLPGVKNMQRSLKSIGMDVTINGIVDAPTVEAVNAVFQGWDDAPAKLKTGNLTAAQISANLPVVQKYLKEAIGGAQEFGDATT